MEALRRGSLTEDELIGAGRHMIAMTQFKTQVKDLPLNWTNPLGRLLMQFSTFAFKSGKFIADEVFKEARHGNFKPFLTLALSAPILGEGVADIKAMIAGRDRPESLLARIAENYAYVGALGIFYDAFKSAAYGEVGLLRRLVGPTVSDLTTLGAGAYEIGSYVASGGKTPSGRDKADPTMALRHLTQQIPFVGPALRPRLFPPKNKEKR
jgi:hypothetical protein